MGALWAHRGGLVIKIGTGNRNQPLITAIFNFVLVYISAADQDVLNLVCWYDLGEAAGWSKLTSDQI